MLTYFTFLQFYTVQFLKFFILKKLFENLFCTLNIFYCFVDFLNLNVLCFSSTEVKQFHLYWSILFCSRHNTYTSFQISTTHISNSFQIATTLTIENKPFCVKNKKVLQLELSNHSETKGNSVFFVLLQTYSKVC